MNLEQHVYKKLLEVPKGFVTTYGDLAKAVGMPNGQRVIGRIMRNNQYPGIVPCHRVICFDGCIGGYSIGGESVKSNMLKQEGIQIKDGKILNLKEKRYRFKIPLRKSSL